MVNVHWSSCMVCCKWGHNHNSTSSPSLSLIFSWRKQDLTILVGMFFKGTYFYMSLRRHTDDFLFVFTNTFLLVCREDKGPISANSYFKSRCYRGAPALEVKRPKVRRMGGFVMEAKIYTVTLSVIFTDLFLSSLNSFQWCHKKSWIYFEDNS